MSKILRYENLFIIIGNNKAHRSINKPKDYRKDKIYWNVES